MFAKSANKISGFVLLIECRVRGKKRRVKKALPFFFSSFFNAPLPFWGVDCCGTGETPVIVRFPVKRDNSVNGTVREHPVWRRGRCALLRWAPGARRRRTRGLQGGCCPPVEPAAGAGPGPSARQHAREPAARRGAPRPALDGKRPGARRRPQQPAPAPLHARRPAPLHAQLCAQPARCPLSLRRNFKIDAS